MAVKVKNVKIDIQSGTDRTVYATWDFTSRDHFDNYTVRWYYGTGDGIWFVAQTDTINNVSIRQATYNAPENALKVSVKIKPVSKKDKKVNGKTGYWWTPEWSTRKEYKFTSNPPSKPPAPSVELKGLKLTASVDNLDVNATHIEFRVYKDDKTLYKTSSKKEIKTKAASFTCEVAAGHQYKVRCRAYKKKEYGEYSDYSANVDTPPKAPDKILQCRALSPTSVYFNWTNVKGATGYEVEYTTKKAHFDSSTDVQSMMTKDGVAQVIGLQTGKEYFFRVRAINDAGNSGWSPIKSVKIGNEPSPPTTWASGNTVTVGEPLNLYWVHNAEDGSTQTRAIVNINDGGSENKTYDVYACKSTSNTDATVDDIIGIVAPVRDSIAYEDVHTCVLVVDFSYSKSVDKRIRLDIDGITYTVYNSGSYKWESNSRVTFVHDSELNAFEIVNIEESPGEGEPDKTFVFPVDTSQYSEGVKLRWKVKTKGIINDYSEYSIERVVDIYAPPTVELTVSDSTGPIETLTSFPFYISAEAGPNTQSPIGYHISVVADEAYDTVDPVTGEDVTVRAGDEVYSEYFDTTINPLVVYMHPGNIDLQPDVSYTVTASVAMNSGLSGVDAYSFNTEWEDEQYEIDGSVAVDPETLTAIISAVCTTEDGTLPEEFSLSVYRREYDGGFVKLESELTNSISTFMVDPHPALDYARYRIVATSGTTGAVTFYDLPAYPVGEKAVVIQWDEEWSTFDTTEEAELEEPPWAGSMLKLPYNIDVSDANRADVEFVEYIGRKHPVTYYGTQVGETSNWNMVIRKDDIDTLYALRRLQKWMGDVYVREPSGSGYWANVSVSFSQKHNELTIPVSMSVTRVEGGA